jgi:Flp pilus assembly pilin Flp
MNKLIKNVAFKKAQLKRKLLGASLIEYALLVAGVVTVATLFFGTDGAITGAITDKLNEAVIALGGQAVEK